MPGDELSRRALTHVDKSGQASMVDVGGKSETLRQATATATVVMRPDTLALIVHNQIKKGDVLSVARISGIMAAKQTPSLIPLCHSLSLNNVSVEFLNHHPNLVEGPKYLLQYDPLTPHVSLDKIPALVL